MKATLFTDAGARGNPGPAGIGVVLKDESGEVIGELADAIGVTTNNVAEYKALIAGLELARDKGVTDIEIFMDSKLVVFQVKGEWKIKNNSLRPLAVKARHLVDSFDSWSLSHVGRDENSDADKLANQAMDAAQLDAELDEEGGGQQTFLQ